MKHEPDCGCLTCYQALREFRDRCKSLAKYWRGNSTFWSCADKLEMLIAESEKRDA